MVVSHHQNAGHHNLLIGNKSFESMAKFKYLEATSKKQTSIHEQIKFEVHLLPFFFGLLSLLVKTQ
jgi:hypothetical protein